MTAVQPSKVDMCRLLSDQPVGAIEYIDKEVNVKEFDWDYWQLHRCEKTTLHTILKSQKNSKNFQCIYVPKGYFKVLQLKL